MTTKTIILSAGLLLASTTTFAQTDAKDYFDGKPWGFATVSDEQGTAYAMDGGMRAAQPTTIVLYAQGDDKTDDNNILNAIGQYDIIILDGSKGDFTVGQNIKLTGLKNKTIVGRNNARLCTQFYLTADDITYLNEQGLDKLSSTDQFTGTLPDGSTITCDKRAFYTKKAMEELSFKKNGTYTVPGYAGIFSVGSCENIIFRNINFIGPGAVDIDGSDLLTNLESKQIWVDHCTFVDGQDGCLDSKRCDYSTYTWNKFYYTDRTFSHPYTNGCGWVDENNPMMIHLTWAFNEWGKGCVRRLPQCGSCYVHIVNNYHNCVGNSAGITLNDNVKGLVEYNYAASGVAYALTGSGDNRYIYAHDNNYSYASTSTDVTVPYSYSPVTDKTKVPSIVEATHGAGATLDDMFMPGDAISLADGFGFYSSSTDVTVGMTAALPLKNLVGAEVTFTSSDAGTVSVDASGKVKAIKEGTATITATVNDAVLGNTTASITVNAKSNSAFTSVKKWDFSTRSTASTDAFSSNGWSVNGDNYTYDSDIDNDELPGLAEAVGLKFTCTQASQIVSYKNSLRINKPFSVTIPSCKAGDKIVISMKSANKTTSRGFEAGTNISTLPLATDGTAALLETSVVADGDVTLNSGTGGFYLFYIDLQRASTSGINEITTSNACHVVFYNIAGQRVSANAKGIIIGSNGKKYFSK